MSEKTLNDYFADWEANTFGFGYGTGEEYTIPALKIFFETVPDDGAYDYREMEKALSPTVAWLLINTLCHADVIDYGTSPRCGWLRTCGKRLQEFFKAHTVDELLMLTCRDENSVPCYPNACNCSPKGYIAGRVCQNPFWLEKVNPVPVLADS